MKRSFAMIAVLVVTLLLAACGATRTSASKAMMESLTGTYVGKNGSALTLFPDGTSEYYYMLDSSVDEGAGEWSYKNGTLTWMYNGTPLTARISEQSSYSFIFGQAEGWNREQYIRASDVAEKRTASEYQRIMRDKLNHAEMNNFDESLNKTYRFGDATVQIPFYWFVDSTEEGQTTYKAESMDTGAAMLLVGYETDLGISNDAFDGTAEYIWELMADNEAYDNGYTTVKAPGRITVGQFTGIQGKISATLQGNPLENTLTFLYDENTGTSLSIELLTAGDTIFSYDRDYSKIVNSVGSAKPAKASTPGSGRTETTPKNTGGVTPELKAFLDSYETFMNQYIAFMQKYENSDDPYAMMTDYLDMLRQYADFAEKLNKYDTDKMSDADSAYYLEVMARITKKLYGAIGQ